MAEYQEEKIVEDGGGMSRSWWCYSKDVDAGGTKQAEKQIIGDGERRLENEGRGSVSAHEGVGYHETE